MRVRFAASDAWIDQVVAAIGNEAAGTPAASKSGRNAAVVASVCKHDAFSNDAAFRKAVTTAMNSGGLPLRRARKPSLSGFESLARSQCPDVWRFRTEDVRINTRDPFSRDYLAPAASRVRPSVEYLFEAAAQVSDGIAAAVARYFVLLTIHPFPDGNGRICRAHFAATVGRWVDGPHLVLTLPWLHQDRNRQFHLLAKIARLGDFQPMLDFHARGIDACRSRFGPHIETLGDAIEGGDDLAVQSTMADIRAGARELIGV